MNMDDEMNDLMIMMIRKKIINQKLVLSGKSIYNLGPRYLTKSAHLNTSAY